MRMVGKLVVTVNSKRKQLKEVIQQQLQKGRVLLSVWTLPTSSLVLPSAQWVELIINKSNTQMNMMVHRLYKSSVMNKPWRTKHQLRLIASSKIVKGMKHNQYSKLKDLRMSREDCSQLWTTWVLNQLWSLQNLEDKRFLTSRINLPTMLSSKMNTKRL